MSVLSEMLPSSFTGFYVGSDQSEPIILTGTVHLVADWKNRVAAPRAPSNYKDEVKISEYIAEKMKTLESEVLDYCPSLLVATNVRAFVHRSVYEDIPEKTITSIIEKAIELGLPIYGENVSNLLRVLYLHTPSYNKPIYSQVKRAIISGAIKCKTLDSVLYTTTERKYIIPSVQYSRQSGEEEHEWYIRVLEDLCIYDKDEWTEINEA